MAKLEEVESTSPPHPTDIGTLDTADSGGLQQKAQHPALGPDGWATEMVFLEVKFRKR